MEKKTDDQLRLMRKAGLVVAEGLAAMIEAAKPGVTTAEVDAVGREVLARRGATSNFLNYGAEYGVGFPGVACISVNDVLVHGIPDKRLLRDGDLVSIDFGAIVQGWHGDAARTIIVGEGSEEDHTLNRVTEEALWAGTRKMRPGRKVNDISKAIEKSITNQGRFGILREYTGHGIGRAMHMAPDVPNVRTFGRSAQLSVGTVLAIEPMVTNGGHRTMELDDDWSVVSADGSRGSHWENTVAITTGGIWVLTEPDGGEARLGELFGPLGD